MVSRDKTPYNQTASPRPRGRGRSVGREDAYEADPSGRRCFAEELGTFMLVFAGSGAILFDVLAEGVIGHLGVGVRCGPDRWREPGLVDLSARLWPGLHLRCRRGKRE